MAWLVVIYARIFGFKDATAPQIVVCFRDIIQQLVISIAAYPEKRRSSAACVNTVYSLCFKFGKISSTNCISRILIIAEINGLALKDSITLIITYREILSIKRHDCYLSAVRSIPRLIHKYTERRIFFLSS